MVSAYCGISYEKIIKKQKKKIKRLFIGIKINYSLLFNSKLRIFAEHKTQIYIQTQKEGELPRPNVFTME